MPKIKFIDLTYQTNGDGTQHVDPTSIPDGYTREERKRIAQCGQRRRGFLRIWNPATEQYAPAEIESPSIEVLRSISSELTPILDKLKQTNVCLCMELFHDFFVQKHNALLDDTMSKKKRDDIVRQAEKQLAQWEIPPERLPGETHCPSCRKPYLKSIWQVLTEEQDAVQRILYLLFGGELDLFDIPYALDYLERWLFESLDHPLAKKNLANLTLGMLGIHQLLQWWKDLKQSLLKNLAPDSATSKQESTPTTENPGDSPDETLTLDSPPNSETSTTANTSNEKSKLSTIK